jgi:hypothetical protein
MVKRSPQSILAAAPASPEPSEEHGVAVTHPLFGVVKGREPGKWLAVRYLDGKAEPITAKRNGKDLGESKHFAVARALEAFKISLLGRHA